MAKFLLLYSGGSMPEGDDELAMVMKAWEAWYTSLGAAVADPGNPFTPMAKMVGSDGSVRDGSAVGMASGYTVLEAASFDEAVEMAKGCPVLEGGADISIFETFDVM